MACGSVRCLFGLVLIEYFVRVYSPGSFIVLMKSSNTFGTWICNEGLWVGVWSWMMMLCYLCMAALVIYQRALGFESMSFPLLCSS